MSTLSFSSESRSDDSELCRILANNSMPGSISVSFRRKPSYFDACDIQGNQYEIIKCQDKSNAKIIGLGSRFIYYSYINGERNQIGYLGDLRIDPEFRSKTILAKGYEFLEKIHK